jgi:hypothetical protein
MGHYDLSCCPASGYLQTVSSGQQSTAGAWLAPHTPFCCIGILDPPKPCMTPLVSKLTHAVGVLRCAVLRCAVLCCALPHRAHMNVDPNMAAFWDDITVLLVRVLSQWPS